MHPIALINAILLCVSNTSFMVGGIILNYAVIVSLLRAPQLRKKLCYFMIFVLSFSDLAAVGITHPVLISSSVLWYMQMYHIKIELTRGYAAVLLGCFSMFALLTLNIERYLATTRPFFHQTFVTKGKLTLFLAFQIITMGALTTLYSFYLKTNLYRNIFITIIVLSFLSVVLDPLYTTISTRQISPRDAAWTPRGFDGINFSPGRFKAFFPPRAGSTRDDVITFKNDVITK